MRGKQYLLGAVAIAVACAADPATAQVVAAWNDQLVTAGSVQVLRSRRPWSPRAARLSTGPDVVLALGRRHTLVTLSRTAGTITVLDRGSWRSRRRIELGAEAQAEDIAVVGPCRAYVSRRNDAHLLRVDLCGGTAVNAADLAAFADADGNPDLGTMIAHEGRLFVQVRRVNEDAPMRFAPPAMLAVLDVASGELIDVDPVTAGPQAIVLEGTGPKHRMQVIASTRRLFVSASGGSMDAGGLEAIDLDTLRSLGLVIREEDGRVGADLGPFLFVTADRGYLTFSTDFDLSSHLTPFSLSGGVEPVELHRSVGYAVPDAGNLDSIGINVFDAATGQRLTPSPIPTSGLTTDVLSLRGGVGP
jgi:hypothetical protein